MNILLIDALISLLIVTAASTLLVQTTSPIANPAGLNLVKAQLTAYDAAIIEMKSSGQISALSEESFCIKSNELNQNCNSTNTVSAEFFVYENGWHTNRVEVGYD